MSELESEEPSEADLLRLLLIVNMRMYDALLTLLGVSDPELMQDLKAKHDAFGYMGSMPFKED
jgi:hypothetical protein